MLHAVTAMYLKEECNLEMVVRLSPAHPLRMVEVSCFGKRVALPTRRHTTASTG